MGSGIRSAKLWSRIWLESMGLTVISALVMMVFIGTGNEAFAEIGLAGIFLEAFAVLPYALMIAEAMVVLMLGISFFQIYISLAVSMGSTRRAALLGSLGTIAGEILAISALSAAMWYSFSDDVSMSGRTLLPLLTGLMFLLGALTVIFGTVNWCWGGVGVVLTAVFLVLAGFGTGVFLKISGANVMEWAGNLEAWFYPGLAAAVFVYLCAGVFAMKIMKTMEVRL